MYVDLEPTSVTVVRSPVASSTATTWPGRWAIGAATLVLGIVPGPVLDLARVAGQFIR